MSLKRLFCVLPLCLLFVGITQSGPVQAQFQFAPATILLPSSNNDGSSSLSSDNLTLYFSSNSRTPGFGSFDIWTATRPQPFGLFGPAVNLGPTVNTSSLDGGPSISLDGLSLFIQSDRPGGLGDNDMWVTTRTTTNDGFGTPVHLGPGVNSPFEDGSPHISADGLTLLFYQVAPGGFGAADLYMATRPTTSVPFGAKVNLGSTINTSGYEYSPSLSTDGLALFFASDRPGSLGSADIWVSTRSSMAAAWGAPVNLGPNVNTQFTEDSGHIAWDGSSIVFRSDRANPEVRGTIYQAAVVPEPSTLALVVCGFLLAGLATRRLRSCA